jgi:hypothetical protein
MLTETTSPIEVPAVAASRQDGAVRDGDSASAALAVQEALGTQGALGTPGVGSRVSGGNRIVLRPGSGSSLRFLLRHLSMQRMAIEECVAIEQCVAQEGPSPPSSGGR